MEELKYIIWLTAVFGSGSEIIWKILNAYESASQAYSELSAGSCRIKIKEHHREKIKGIPLSRADEIITSCVMNGINILPYTSPEYPSRLKSTACPPPVIYYKGNISCIAGKNITCIGTRNPSDYTLNIISGICGELAVNNFTIVSGFAVGCDIACHMSAVGASRPTACVLGCGINVNYPSANNQYRNKILSTGGVFISEFPPDTPAFVRNFPQRNRILSALSDTVIVFEASEKSGSLNTAGIAIKQHKKLLCVPPADITDKRYSGNISLLRTGAVPLYSVSDITGKEPPSPPPPVEKHEKHDDIQNENTGDLTPLQKKILSMFDGNILHTDRLIAELDMDISELMIDIMELQFAGIIEEVTANQYRKCERRNI